MEFDEHAARLLIAYYQAHDLWKKLPVGDEKVEAKRVRGQRHSELLAVAELIAKKAE